MDGLATFFWIPNNIESIINEFMALTGQVRHRLQLLFPELGDGDALFLLVSSISRHSLFVGMLQDLLEVFWLQRVEDIEEVLPRRPFACWIRIREVLREVGIFLEMRPQGLHRKLIIMWHCHPLDILFLHQHLLAGEDGLEEVLVDDVGFR